MQSTICVLGRQPAIGRAELESLFGKKLLRPIGDNAIELQIEPQHFSMHRLGGTVKACKLLTTLDTTDTREIEKYISSQLPTHLQYFKEGKINFGLSFYGFRIPKKSVTKIGMNLKTIIKNEGRSVRLVPNSFSDLSSAQVIHNKLTSPMGMELVLVRDGRKTILAQTIEVQDIANYTLRDRKRPKRDAYVGMLPPKLAQIIINLAVGDMKQGTVLDPFCGTGVILQESLLMNFDAYGSDLEPRMIDYSSENLEWLNRKYQLHGTWHLEVGDATTHAWHQRYNTIAAETYLGTPLTKAPSPSELRTIVNESNELHRKVLKNLSSQLPKDFRLCLAIPAWVNGRKITHLPLLDDLKSLGYTRLSFAHVRDYELVYFREDQLVARELVVLKKV